jgi:hypothetical protein
MHQKDGPQVVVGWGVFRVQLNSFLKGSDGFGNAFLSPQSSPEVAVAVRSGSQLQSFLEALNRLVIALEG